MIILTHFNKSIQASREVKIDVWLCEVLWTFIYESIPKGTLL